VLSSKSMKKGIPSVCNNLWAIALRRYPMLDITQPSTPTLADWPHLVAQSWNKLSRSTPTPEARDLAADLAARLCLDQTVALGFLQAVETLLSFAKSAWPETDSVVDQERLSLKVALASVRPIFEARLQQRFDQIDQLIPQVSCQLCGHEMISQGRRSRSWSSTLGELQLRRRYSWCQACQTGKSIAQEKVGLSETSYTPALEEITTLMATTVPHDLAVALIYQFLGISISDKASKNMVFERAQTVQEQIQEEAEEVLAYSDLWGAKPAFLETARPTKEVELAYLEVDGVIVRWS
jgi:hypothetical protein